MILFSFLQIIILHDNHVMKDTGNYSGNSEGKRGVGGGGDWKRTKQAVRGGLLCGGGGGEAGRGG